MTECRVTCTTCRTEAGLPKTWHWLCETCAEECQHRHRAETGHETELRITTSLADVVNLSAAAAIAIRKGW